MRYPETVNFLYSLGNEIRSVKFGLDSIRNLLDELGEPQNAFRIVHIAGTNGKGSTCAMIESALRRAGLRTGLYTSPHLIEPTERVRINGVPVTRHEFAAAFQTVHDANERLLAAGILDHHTTYFETVTAMAFLLFLDAGIDIAVVETGLGGRLDATNIVVPDLCVITPVDFDHEQYLGSSLPLIAGEKAGILKPQRPVVFARQRLEAAEVLEKRALELDCPVVRTMEYSISDLRVHCDGADFTAARDHEFRVHCPLPGAHQVENAIAAVAALECMGVSSSSIEEGIAATQWPARLQRVSTSPDILIDGAHNPSGARALAQHIQTFYAERPVWLVYGAMRDKSVQEITEILFPLARTVILTSPSSARSLRPEALRAATEHPDVRIARRPSEALAMARTAPPDHAVFITGSLYLAGEILALLQ